MLLFFRNRKQLFLHKYNRLHLHDKRGRTNLGGEGEIEVARKVVGVKAT